MAKASIHCSIAKPDEFKAHLARVFTRAAIEGIDLTTHGKQSGAKLICYAVKLGADACDLSVTKAPLTLPAPTGPTDTERLKAAMARAGLTNATLGALLGVSRDVVKNAVRGLAMGPNLRAWLAEQEEIGR